MNICDYDECDYHECDYEECDYDEYMWLRWQLWEERKLFSSSISISINIIVMIGRTTKMWK